MLDMPGKHPGLHMKFSVGHHSVRMSDRLWSGLSTDLLIEQVMTKTIKSPGSFMHGRRITQSVHCLWVHSLHECASVHAAINDLDGIDLSAGSDYHDDLGKGWRSRDFQDLNKMLEFFATTIHLRCKMADCTILQPSLFPVKLMVSTVTVQLMLCCLADYAEYGW